MNTKTMEQPQTEWWVSFLKWIETNMVMFIVAGVIYNATNKFFALLTKWVDGRLNKVAESVVIEKMKPIDEKIDGLKEQVEFLTKLLMEKK
jgi:hypothetical protein